MKKFFRGYFLYKAREYKHGWFVSHHNPETTFIYAFGNLMLEFSNLYRAIAGAFK